MEERVNNTVFSTRLENFLPFSSNLELSSAYSFNLEESNIVILERFTRFDQQYQLSLYQGFFFSHAFNPLPDNATF